MYFNQAGRTEFNTIINSKVNDNLGSTTMLHGSVIPFKMDRNEDGFTDMPIGSQLNLVQRFKYSKGTKMWQLGVKG